MTILKLVPRTYSPLLSMLHWKLELPVSTYVHDEKWSPWSFWNITVPKPKIEATELLRLAQRVCVSHQTYDLWLPDQGEGCMVHVLSQRYTWATTMTTTDSTEFSTTLHRYRSTTGSSSKVKRQGLLIPVRPDRPWLFLHSRRFRYCEEWGFYSSQLYCISAMQQHHRYLCRAST